MPKNPPIGKRFQPGVSGNPDGARKHDQVKKKLKRLTTKELEKVVHGVLLANPENLQQVRSEDPTVLKHWITSIAVTGMKKGDFGPLQSLLDRIIGKVTDKLNVVSESKESHVFVIPANGREAKLDDHRHDEGTGTDQEETPGVDG